MMSNKCHCISFDDWNVLWYPLWLSRACWCNLRNTILAPKTFFFMFTSLFWWHISPTLPAKEYIRVSFLKYWCLKMSLYIPDTQLIFLLNIYLSKSDIIGIFWSFMYNKLNEDSDFFYIISKYLADGRWWENE